MTTEEIKALLLKDDSQYVKDHLGRLTQSLEFLQNNLPLSGNCSCIDTGSSTYFSDILTRCYKDVSIQCDLTAWDLRYPFPVDSSKYDIALSMEVFEHIKDRDSDEKEWVAAWTYTGALSYLCEINRILKMGGNFFITTPNFGTWRTFYRLLGHECPMFFRHHVREYTISELKQFLEVTGFRVEVCVAKNVWGDGDLHPQMIAKFKQFCSDNGYNVSNRGDDIFILAQKVSEPNEILFKTDYFNIEKSYLFSEQFKPRILI